MIGLFVAVFVGVALSSDPDFPMREVVVDQWEPFHLNPTIPVNADYKDTDTIVITRRILVPKQDHITYWTFSRAFTHPIFEAYGHDKWLSFDLHPSHVGTIVGTHKWTAENLRTKRKWVVLEIVQHAEFVSPPTAPPKPPSLLLLSKGESE